MILTHLLLFGFFEPTSVTPLSYQRGTKGIELGFNRGLA
jgi:hypothetical protein